MYQNMVEVSHVVETEMVPKTFDAVVVCGMGPLALRETRPETAGKNLVARNLYNFLNAIAGKLLVAHGVTDEVIVSGFKSQKQPGDSVLREIERNTTEAQLLKHTFERAHPKGVSPEDRMRADKAVTEEPLATTTFGNFIQALNQLDAKAAGGHWDGSLGVVSSEFHGPRISEMLKMFGVNGRFISAERVMHRFGYKNVYPRESSSWKELEQATYNGQPQNYENLRQNPAYVTKYLAEIASPRRIQEMASALRRYIIEHDPNNLPDAFQDLPDAYDPLYDYEGLKVKFAAVPADKKTFLEAPSVEAYRKLAYMIGNETTNILKGSVVSV